MYNKIKIKSDNLDFSINRNYSPEYNIASRILDEFKYIKEFNDGVIITIDRDNHILVTTNLSSVVKRKSNIKHKFSFKLYIPNEFKIKDNIISIINDLYLSEYFKLFDINDNNFNKAVYTFIILHEIGHMATFINNKKISKRLSDISYASALSLKTLYPYNNKNQSKLYRYSILESQADIFAFREFPRIWKIIESVECDLGGN